MTNYNPYVNTLIEMGYDEQDCRNVAAAGDANVTYPRIIHGRTFETKNNMMMQLLTLSMVFEFV
jgi:hypothetical protein